MTSRPLDYYANISVFLFFTLALIIPSGYSYGSAALAIASLPFLFKKRSYQNLNKETLWVVTSLLSFSMLGLLEAFAYQMGTSAYEKPSLFLFAVGILVFLNQYPPKQKVVWFSLAAGGVATGVFAVIYKYTTGAARVDGYNNAIQFGNISLLIGLLSLSGVLWAFQQKKYKLFWVSFLLVGFLFGLIASLLSGSRGGWISIPAALFYTAIHYKKIINYKAIIIFFIGISILLIAGYQFKTTGIADRIQHGVQDINKYNSGMANTSIGTRLELWKGSLILFIEKPVFGWGRIAFEQRLTELKKEKIISPAIISHSHNDILYTAARHGTVGLIVLFGLYMTPIVIFRKLNKRANIKQTSLALAGIILILCYFDFGLTQAFLSHNSGIIFFITPLAILLSCLNNELSTNKI